MVINWANWISFVRIVTAFVAAYLIIHGLNSVTAIAASVLLGIGVLMDVFDGRVARRGGYAHSSGKIVDNYADHILANVTWIAMAFSGMVSAWVPIIFVTRETVVDGLRQIGKMSRDIKATEDVKSPNLEWISSHRLMRFLTGLLKIVSWWGLIVSFVYGLELYIEIIVWLTVAICLIRAIPALQSNWDHFAFVKFKR